MTSASENLPTVRAIWEGAVPLAGARGVCLFASFDVDSLVPETTVHYLKALVQEGYAVYFVTTSKHLSDGDLLRLKPLCTRIVHRDNAGYDFYSWKTGLAVARKGGAANLPLLFTNDSILGPVNSMAPVFKAIQTAPETVWGLTDSNETGTWHLQSYFFHVSAHRAGEGWFSKFWDDVRITSAKHLVIQNYEVGFTVAALAAGVPCAAVYPSESVVAQAAKLGYEFQYRSRLAQGGVNTTLFMWDILLRDYGFPFMKAELLRQDRFAATGLANWPALLPEASAELIAALQDLEERSLWRGAQAQLKTRPSRLAAWLTSRIERSPSPVLRKSWRHAKRLRRFVRAVVKRDDEDVKIMTAKLKLAVRRRLPLVHAKLALTAKEGEASRGASRREEYFAEARRQFASFLFAGHSLDLSPLGPPRLTVVLILYNKAELTYRCLRSLAALRSEVPFEVLIIDNDSRDLSPTLTARLEGVRVVRNAQNVGFLKACNQARDLVTTELLLLLNNDTEVHPGSLAAAVETLGGAKGTKVGAVGGRIILPDGRLQEAGNIIWRDGTCVGYGRDLDAAASEAMFRRPVDYCSGAFLMTRQELFLKLGGFDEDFAPAYYEETDYCIRLQKAGYAVVYDPRVSITHVEFGSAELSADAFNMMHRNRAKLVAKHDDYLATQLPPNPPDQLRARSAKWAAPGRRLLIVDDRVPNAQNGAGYPRANQVVRQLAEMGFAITIVCREFFDGQWHKVYTDLALDIEIVPLLEADDLSRFLKERAGYYDVFWISRPGNMAAVNTALAQGKVARPKLVVYDSEAFFAERALIEAEVLGIETTSARRALAQEIREGVCADLVVAVSQRDCAKWLENSAAKAVVVGHDATLAFTPKPFGERRDILFAGTLYGLDSPNGDSLCWFMREVMPYLRRHWGDSVRLCAAGYVEAGLKARLSRRSLRNFHLIGPYDDPQALFDSFKIVVIPTRFAAGIPQKAFDAATYGIPTVCSSLIASQLSWRDGQECLVAAVDDPKAFAEACIRLYEEADLWQTIRSGAGAYLEQYNLRESIAVGMQKVATIFEEKLSPSFRGSSPTPADEARQGT